MKPAGLDRIAAFLSLGAGALDTGTGLGLVLAPTLVLPLMLVPVPGAEALVYVRFIGTFVGSVGASYLWGLLVWRNSGSPALLRAVLRLTILFRLTAGSYVLVAVLGGRLGPAWLSVTATDWTLAALQSWLLARGALREA
jgi:hypothetical protein